MFLSLGNIVGYQEIFAAKICLQVQARLLRSRAERQGQRRLVRSAVRSFEVELVDRRRPECMLTLTEIERERARLQ